MNAISGGFFAFAILAIAILKLGGDVKQHFDTSFGGRATRNETVSSSSPSEQPTQVAFNGDAVAIAQAMDAVKPIATGKVIRNGQVVGTKLTDEDKDRANQEKVRIVAPLVLNALQECPKPIPPEQLTSHLETETEFCPGVPVRKCPCSEKGACSPLQLMPATIAQYAKPGENPEALVDSLRIAVRHLCFARGKDNAILDPASDAAILRYNKSTDYLNLIRANQSKHKPTWSSIKSNGVPVMANTASPATGTVATTAPVLTNTNGFMPMIGHPEKQLRTATGVDGTPTAYPIAIGEGYLSSMMGDDRVVDGKVHHTHGGSDVTAEEGVIIVAAADGIVRQASWNHSSEGGERAGIHVLIEHNVGSRRPGQLATTSSMHCQKVLVAVGQQVKRGEPIATVGSTAVFTYGAHLHFQATKWGANGQRELAGLSLYFDSSRHNPKNSLYAGPNIDGAKAKAKKFEAIAQALRGNT